MNTEERLPIETAGRVVGLPPSTLRAWVDAGTLPAIGDQRGTFVRLGDVLALAERGGRASPADPAVGRVEPGTEGDDGDRSVTTREIIPATAQRQWEVVRDALLRPHLERVEALAREVGRLQTERDAAVAAWERAERRLAGDRVLVELAAAEADRRVAIAADPDESPLRATGWAALRVLVWLAVLATLATYAGLTIDDLRGDADEALLSLDRARRAAAIGLAAAGLIVLVMGPLAGRTSSKQQRATPDATAGDRSLQTPPVGPHADG